MTRDKVIERAAAERVGATGKGVAHAALFGSRAREDQRSDSDTDIMVAFDLKAHVTVFHFDG